MRIPNKSDIRRALTHARWLLSIKDPLNQQDRMLADLGFAYDALMQERDRLKQHSDANAALYTAIRHTVTDNKAEEKAKDTLSCLSSSGDKKALYDFAEILADISGNLTVANYIDRVKIENSRDVVSLAIDWAIEFTRLHAATDWNEVEYIETVDNFTEEKIKALIA